MAYVIEAKDRSDFESAILPAECTLKNGAVVSLSAYEETHVESMWQMLNHVIAEGSTYPQDKPLTLEGFRQYFLSHSAFVVTLKQPPTACEKAGDDNSEKETGGDGEKPKDGAEKKGVKETDGQARWWSTEAAEGQVVGCFYIKPNFPGRSSHICNAGFVTLHLAEGQGVGRFMATTFLTLAKELEYRASFFNLVYVTNLASIHLWRSMGFREVGTVPQAGRLRDGTYVDALQFYYDFNAAGDDN